MSEQDERNRSTTGGFLLGCIVGGLVALGAGGGWVWVQRQHAQAMAAEERIAAEQAALEAQRQVEKPRQHKIAILQELEQELKHDQALADQRQAEKARQKPVPAKVEGEDRMPKADE